MLYLENLIKKDFNHALFVHLETGLYSEISDSNIPEQFVLNSESEIVDFYKASGVKHLLILNSKDLKNKGLFDLLFEFIKQAESIWVDPSFSSDVGKELPSNQCNFLPSTLSDFNPVCKLLNAGKVKDVAEKLGYLYQLRGKVIHGNNLGQKLGYPTANLSVDDKRKIIPAKGVYIAFVKANNNWHKSMVNVGMRPTLNNNELTIEAHIFEFNNSIYGKDISIHFCDKLRNEKRFPSVELLKKQMITDEKNALAAIENIETKFHFTDGFCFKV